MLKSDRLHGLLPIIAASALLAPLPAGAQAGADADTREINAYKLTEAGLTHYAQAARNIAQLASQSPVACADDQDDADSGDGKSIGQMVASLDADTKVRSAIQSTGMSTREYVVFGMAVFQAGLAAWALDQPGGKLPAGVAMDNVTFYRKHEAALRTLGEETKSADCDDAGEDEPQ
jgi:hypothetical protein